MDPFTTLASRAVALMDDDIDTDIIYPARFLLLMDKTGLGDCFFADRRTAAHGQFVFDRPEHQGAGVLIAGDNFGCGSSREHAVWALVGAGFRCVISTSFGEIFYGNCFKNGVLPIVLPLERVAALAKAAEAGAPFTIDLIAQTINAGDGQPEPFEIEASRRAMLLNGWDEIDLVLKDDGPAIDAFEAAHRETSPWLFGAALEP